MNKKRKAILVVDDEEINRELLKQIFEDEYDILMAEDGNEAIVQISKHIDEIAIVLLDLVMPVLNGYQVLQVLNAKKIVDTIPVVLVTAQQDKQLELACYGLGASAVILKPYMAQSVKIQVTNIIELHHKAEHLEEKVENYKEKLNIERKKLQQFNEGLLEAISNIVEFRDLETGQHVKRVKGFTRILAQTYMHLFPEEGLNKHQIDIIVSASALHDIGKIAIPDSILLKPGRLTDEEREIMMNHTTKGCEILNLLTDVQDGELFAVAYEICRHHHERYDGGGYPDHLVGDDIPLSAQLVSVADVYDALVSVRVYKKPFDKDTAFHMIIDGKCGVFSDKMLQCFEDSRNAIEAFSDNQ